MLVKYSIFLLLTAMFFFGACKQQSSKNNKLPRFEKKPNIVFILVDDLGLMDLNVTGSTFYETPNIDRLANQSMIFTHGYAASRVCSPSRASIMTGKFTARHGITDWIGAKSGEAWRDLNRHNKLLPAEYGHELSKEDQTIAETLRLEGYKTFFSGKWHLGSKGSYPDNHGFEINKGGWEKGSPIGGYFSPWQNPKLENIESGEHLSMRLAKETVSFIEDNKNSSFFAFLSFYAVHGPIQTTNGKWNKYRTKAEINGIADKGYKMEAVLPIRQVQDNPVYAGLVEQMDEAVGLVLDALETLGIEDETIVIFTSDNGGVSSGDSFSTSNLPLRGGKGYQWEGGIREPFFIKVPWFENNESKSDYPVIGTDFYPTILDLAGVDLLPEQHVDGISLKPILQGNSLEISRPLYWHYPHYGNQGGEPSSIIQENGWKLIHYWEDGHDELYRLETDIAEQHNLALQHPVIKEEMSNQLHSWLIEVGANFASIDVKYDSVSAKAKFYKTVNSTLPALERARKEVLSKDFRPNEDWWGSLTIKD